MSGADHDGLRQIGAEIRKAQQQDAGADRLRQRAAVVASASTKRDGSGPLLSLRWAGLGALALAAVAVLWVRSEQPRSTEPTPSTLAKSGHPPSEPVRAVEPATSEPAPPVATSDDGPTASKPLQLASGTIELAPDTDREVVAGPHRIDVSAEDRVAFTWSPAQDLLEVRVEDGSVDLHVATSTHTVTAGYRARVEGSAVVITRTRAIAKAAETDPGNTDAPRNSAWKRLAKEGRYADALAQATRAGALKKTGSASKADLKLLADVARLGGAPQDSITVLQTLRQRFPKSREARRAAFYLGRQAEREARLEDAASWYRTYLEGTARGSLRAEARGRLLGVLRRRGDKSAARSVAREVLEDDPQGAYVDLARKTLGGAP